MVEQPKLQKEQFSHSLIKMHKKQLKFPPHLTEIEV